MTTRRIVALGGHEFRIRDPELAIVEQVLSLTGASSPRVCLLPTATGDERDGIASFYTALDRFDCLGSHVSLFRLEGERVDLRRHILDQDLVYVAGGSLLNLLAVWRTHGLPAVLAEAWRSGVVLCGQSAGALCWFDHAITSSSGRPRPTKGLGLVGGSLCVHYARDPERRAVFLERVGAGEIGAGWGLDDGAGLAFEDSRPPVALSGRAGARAIRVEAVDGSARETRLDALTLSYRSTAEADPAIEERRALRLARAAQVGHRLALRDGT